MNIAWNSYPDKKPSYSGIFLVRLNGIPLSYLYYSVKYDKWEKRVPVSEWYDLGVFLHEVNAHCLIDDNLTE